MKRTPLKRGKSIRRKRKTERSNQDRLTKERYLEANPVCELIGIITPPGGHVHGVDPHHIGRIKHDVWECLLSACRNCHEFGHRNDREFIIWCLYAKWKKGELDLELMNKLTKGKRLQWYLQVEPGMQPETVRMIEEMLAAGLGE